MMWWALPLPLYVVFVCLRLLSQSVRPIQYETRTIISIRQSYLALGSHRNFQEYGTKYNRFAVELP